MLEVNLIRMRTLTLKMLPHSMAILQILTWYLAELRMKLNKLKACLSKSKAKGTPIFGLQFIQIRMLNVIGELTMLPIASTSLISFNRLEITKTPLEFILQLMIGLLLWVLRMHALYLSHLHSGMLTMMASKTLLTSLILVLGQAHR